MAYWVLYEREDGRWHVQFGSTEKADVVYERQDMREGYRAVKARDLKIVRFDHIPNNAEVIAKAQQLNG